MRAHSPIDGDLRGATSVTVVKSTHFGYRDDVAKFGWLNATWFRGVLGQRKMGPSSVVVTKVAAQFTAEMSLAEHDYVVQKVSADGADHSLGVWILPWRPCRDEDLVDTEALNALPEEVAIDGVTVAQQIPGCRVFWNASTICCAVQDAVGESVTAKCTTPRRK